MFTCVGDVEALSRVGVVRLELETHDVAVAGNLRGHVLPRESAECGGLGHPIILHNEIVKLRLHVEVTENEMDPAACFGYDEPHAVHVVSVLFRVVGGKDDARRRSEIEEAGNCRGKERNGNKSPCHSLSTGTEKSPFSFLTHSQGNYLVAFVLHPKLDRMMEQRVLKQ